MITKKPLFYWILHRNRLFQFFLLILAALSIFFRVFPLEMQKRIINTAINLRKQDLLFLYCGLYIAAVILSGLIKYAVNVMQKYLGQKILAEIRAELYRHILLLPMEFFRRTPPGTVISAMSSELAAVGHFIGGAIIVPITGAVTLLTFAGYMILLDFRLGLISMGIYPLELIIIPMLQRRYNRFNIRRIDTVRSMNNLISEAVSGIHEVRGNAGHKTESEKIAPFIAGLFSVSNRMFVIKYSIKWLNNLFQNFGPFLLFLIGGYLAIQGEFTLGALVAFLSAYEKIYDPWKELIEYYQDFQDAKVRYQRVMQYFDDEPESDEGADYPVRMKGTVDVQELNYSINNRKQLLNNISLHLEAGEHLALVGFSGSGKSTLAMLLGRIYPYKNGHIRIDGRELASFSRKDIARNIAFVAQHPFIFRGSIRENLLYGCRSLGFSDEQPGNLPDLSKLKEMIRETGLLNDVMRFGFDSVVEEKKHGHLVRNLYKMRMAVRHQLMREAKQPVEFYDADRFLYHISIYQNILFGDMRDGNYAPENICRNPHFLSLLRDTDLMDALMRLGLNLAKETVLLIGEVRDDDFFFKGTPVRPDEFEIYKEITARAGRDNIPEAKDEIRILELAIRYVPARHRIVAMQRSFPHKILAARHRFIREIGKTDMEKCLSIKEKFMKGENPEMLLPDEEETYSLYCPARYLRSRTLLENILFGTPCNEEYNEINELRDMVTEILEKEGLADMVISAGLDFQVGSKGDRLSGGQRQKIAIARALLKESPILIMDEATASLDNASQARIQKYTEKVLRGKTSLVAVVHRLDITRSFDRILVLRAGTAVETGNYDELMEKKGVFYELVRGAG